MITKEAKDPSRFMLPFYYTQSARSGFESFLQWFNETCGGKVLLPAYIGETEKEGSGVMDPVRNAGVAYDFYSVNRQLQPDLDALHARLASGAYKAMLVIHYYGFVQCDMAKIKGWCQEHDVLLIEDCAHTLRSHISGQALGTFGDCAFHSLHKLTAAQEGGLFLVHSDLRFSVPAAVTSKLSVTALNQYLRTDLDKTAEVRRENYQYYLDHLPYLSGIEWLYPELPVGVVPLNFPILIQGGKREPLYFALVDRGVTVVSLYYRLIHEIDEQTFPVSYDISRSILNLPTHQDMRKEDMDVVIQAMVESHKDVFNA